MLGMWTSTNLKKENHHNSKWLTDDVHWIVKDRNWDSDYKVIPNISCLKSQVKSYKKSWSNLGKKLTKTITKTKQNKEEQIKSKEHIILKMLHRCLSAVISPTTNFMQTWITLQKSGKFFCPSAIQNDCLAMIYFHSLCKEPPPTPPLLLTQTRHVPGRQKTKRKKEQILQLLISTLPVYY